MRSADIKNLSIAMEALSRIPGTSPEHLSTRIHNLLESIITEEEETSAKPRPSTTNDDEIPF